MAASPRSWQSSVWLSTLVSYADRGVAFLLPLLVLKGLGQPSTYAAIEYVVSISIIMATFCDLGLRSYVLFHYRNSGDKALTAGLTALSFAPLFALQIVAILIAALCFAIPAGGSDELTLSFLGVTRGAALSVIGILTQIFIMQGRPVLGPMLSVLHWSLGVAVVAVPQDSSLFMRTSLFFAGSFLLLLMAAAGLMIRRVTIFSGEGISHLKSAFAWAWPILAAACCNMLIANFSRVYAFARLPEQEAVGFMFWLRVFSIIQLTHVSVVAVLSLEIFESKKPGFLMDNFRRYCGYLAIPVSSALLLPLVFGMLMPDLPPISSGDALAILGFMVLWCVGAYLEVFVSRGGQNRQLLLAAAASALVYMLGVFILEPSTVLLLASLMMAAAATYLVMMILRVRRIEA